jgi:hypothetical protein
MSYYKIINGKKMDSKIIDQANLLVAGAGDGRISRKDATTLLTLVTDRNNISNVENDTVDYLIKNYQWTAEAAEWFHNEVRVWKSHKAPVSMTIAELSGKHFATVDVLKDPVDQAARKHILESASLETNQDHDDIGLWIRLKDGTTVEVFSNFIALEEQYVELRGGCIVPVIAIEKVEI